MNAFMRKKVEQKRPTDDIQRLYDELGPGVAQTLAEYLNDTPKGAPVNIQSLLGALGITIADGSITASKLNVSTLSSISANIGSITAGSISGVTITGGTFQTSSGTTHRIVISGNAIEIFDDLNQQVGTISGDNILYGSVVSADFSLLRTGVVFLTDDGVGSSTFSNPGISADGVNTNVSARVASSSGGEVVLIPADGAYDSINNRVRVYERINLENRGSDPTHLVTGDMWVKGGKLYIYNGSASVVVGTQT